MIRIVTYYNVGGNLDSLLGIDVIGGAGVRACGGGWEAVINGRLMKQKAARE